MSQIEATGQLKGRVDAEIVASNGMMGSATNSTLRVKGGGLVDRQNSQSPESHGTELEGAGLLTEGYFSQHCDTASLSSFSLDTPSLSRKLPPQEDTASLVSIGTLVPEAIYLPPPGYKLVTHSDWDAMNTQVTELQEERSRLKAERVELERVLDVQTIDTQKQVSLLQSEGQTSEVLLQELQTLFVQSQHTIQSQLVELSISQRKVCCELSRLKGENRVETDVGQLTCTLLTSTLKDVHCEERLRIEIVNLKEQMDARAEESEVLEVQLSSLKTETEKIQGQKEKLQAELHACHTELQALRVVLAHLQVDSKTLNNDKASLQQECLELRSQVISLRSQMDTSQTVQKDFVKLSQLLQVKLELIRQTESLDQIREILEEGLPKGGNAANNDM